MLAPPGYAKMTSTPSRSRASTRMSRPNMAAPTSARARVDFPGCAEAPAFEAAAFFAAVSVVLLMCSIPGFMDKWIYGLWEPTPSVSPHQSNSPIIHSSSFLVLADGRRCNKKPTTVSSRGFLSKFYLTTSANGVVSYDDDYQRNLSVIV